MKRWRAGGFNVSDVFTPQALGWHEMVVVSFLESEASARVAAASDVARPRSTEKATFVDGTKVQ
jgi:hypothetical protein